MYVFTETRHLTSEDLPLRRAFLSGYLISDSSRATNEYATHLSTNHGGIVFIYRSNFTVCRIQLDIVPIMFELHVSRAVIIAAIYRPSSVAASEAFLKNS